jgi:uncharacterized damage-inducible protein DinB
MEVSSTTEVARLADQLERSFRGGAWHGPAIREAISGLDAAAAGRRPRGASHSIVSLVRHMTFWIDAATVRIGGGRDVDPGGDWPEEGTLSDEAWKQAIAELERAHERLYAVLVDLEDERLGDAVPGSDPTVRGLLLGTLQHNAYHTGQIVHIARELAT